MNSIPIRFETFTISEDIIYFADYYFNMIGSYNVATQKLEVLAFIDDELRNQERLFGEIIFYNDNLYLIPFSSEKFYIINVSSHRVSAIELPHLDHKYAKYDNKAKFLSAHLVDDKIIMMPATIPAIAIMNLSDNTISYCIEGLDEVIDSDKSQEDSFFRKTVYQGNYIYAPICMKAAVLVMDVRTLEYHLVEFGNIEGGLSNICYDGNFFWMLSRRGNSIFKWNGISSETEVINCKWECNTRAGDVDCWNGRIILFPASFDKVIAIDIQSLSETVILDEESRYAKCIYNNTMYISDYYKGRIIQLTSDDMNEEELKQTERMFAHYEVYFSPIYELYTNSGITVFNENTDNSVRGFLDFINVI